MPVCNRRPLPQQKEAREFTYTSHDIKKPLGLSFIPTLARRRLPLLFHFCFSLASLTFKPLTRQHETERSDAHKPEPLQRLGTLRQHRVQPRRGWQRLTLTHTCAAGGSSGGHTTQKAGLEESDARMVWNNRVQAQPGHETNITLHIPRQPTLCLARSFLVACCEL